jgi:UDP-glucose 4-epimerase
MNKVVVIGGSGFLGSHTADVLTERGYRVVIYDQKKSRWIRDNQEFVAGDVLDSEELNDVVRGAKFLYHFAGTADIGEAKKNPFETININVMGATSIAQAAVENKVERFVYASTMYVYSPYGSFYRASKQAAETIIEAYSEQFGMEYTFLRYGSLYGPRSQQWNGLRKYVEQVVREGKLVYPGSGNERREYIHVSDAARLSVDILDQQHKNQAITVTGHQILNSNELIDMIFEISGLPQKVEFSGANTINEHYEMTPYRFTPKKAKKLIPEEFIDIGQGILELVEEIHGLIEKEDGLETE